MKLAIFDFDGTLFSKDTLPFLLSKWKILKCSRFTYYRIYLSIILLFLKYKLEKITGLSREQMKVQAVRKFNRIFAGRTEQELIGYFLICSQEITGLLNQTVVNEVKKARAEGFHTVLLSGTYTYLLKNIGEYLAFDTVIGSEMGFKKGLFDPNEELKIVIGDRKLEKIREYFPKESVDWEGSKAYADGYSDIDLLQAVGNPVAVNPDTKLKPIALEKNWRILT